MVVQVAELLAQWLLEQGVKPHGRRSGVFFPSGRRHTRCLSDWSSDVCSSDLMRETAAGLGFAAEETIRTYVLGAAAITGAAPNTFAWAWPASLRCEQSEAITVQILHSLRHLTALRIRLQSGPRGC